MWDTFPHWHLLFIIKISLHIKKIIKKLKIKKNLLLLLDRKEAFVSIRNHVKPEESNEKEEQEEIWNKLKLS